MSFDELCSHLVRSPWGGLNGLTMSEIAQMTDYQLVHIYLRVKDEDDRWHIDDSEPLEDDGIKRKRITCYQELFIFVWQKRGMSLEDIRKKWDADKDTIWNWEPWQDNLNGQKEKTA